MLVSADNLNGELPSCITGANKVKTSLSACHEDEMDLNGWPQRMGVVQKALSVL